MRILVRAPIGTTGGYARDGVGLIQALLERDHSVDVYPTTVSPPLPMEVAELLTFPIQTSGYDLEIHHVPPTDAFTGAYNRQRARKVVLWSMWEWDTFPRSVESFDRADEYIRNYDHVVGYTQQSLDAFRDAGFLDEGQVTSVVQGGFQGNWEPMGTSPIADQVRASKYPHGPFRFGMVGHLSMRKNPYTVLTAFNELKAAMGDDFHAELLFKTGYPLLPPDYNAPDVKFIQEIGWNDEELQVFYWTLDCLINVSWGEGKDLPSIEATLSGIPTILNDTPGHRGWVHPGIQDLIPSTKMNMDSEYVGRFTSKDDVKKAMLDVYTNYKASYRRANQLANYVSKRATWDYRVEKFGEAIGVPL